MKLLFDHNLPPLLVSRLADLFPQSQHVFALGLDRASDWEIRDFARQSDYSIVTKDADFSDLCVLLGFPPKIIGFVEETVQQRPLRYLEATSQRH
jgi:predicted nuclease of predicted toxin-antitoxin system